MTGRTRNALPAARPGTSVEHFVERFAAGWRSPHRHAWDDLVADDLLLRQPLLPTRRGREALAEEYGRLLRLVPDLTGEVIRWTAQSTPGEAYGHSRSSDETVIDIHLQLRGTIGGRASRLDLIDVCTLRGGLLSERSSYFDPTPVIAAMAKTLTAWARWWRSGVGPAVARRRLLELRTPRISIPVALAVGRLVLGVPAWSAPGVANRIYGFDDPHGETTRYLTALYGARAIALAAGTLVARDATERRRWQMIGLGVDVADTVAGLRIGLPARARWTSVATTGAYAVAGFTSLSRRPSQQSITDDGARPSDTPPSRAAAVR